MRPEYYIGGISLIGLAAGIIDARLSKGKERNVLSIPLAIISVLGGAGGVLIASLLFGGKSGKDNIFARLFSFCVLVIQCILLVLLLILEPPYEYDFPAFFAGHIWLAAYIALASVFSFALFGIDKKRAERGGRRISIAGLLLSAAAGGSPGAIIGMFAFRHKTKKNYFFIGLPMILLVQILLLFLAMNILG